VIQTVRHKTGYSVAVISQVLRAEQYYRPLLNTLVVSAIATVISVLLGAVLAWIVARLDIPGRAWLKVGLTVPYLIPAFIFAFAWRELLGPVGYVNKAFMALTGSDAATRFWDRSSGHGWEASWHNPQVRSSSSATGHSIPIPPSKTMTRLSRTGRTCGRSSPMPGAQ